MWLIDAVFFFRKGIVLKLFMCSFQSPPILVSKLLSVHVVLLKCQKKSKLKKKFSNSTWTVNNFLMGCD